MEEQARPRATVGRRRLLLDGGATAVFAVVGEAGLRRRVTQLVHPDPVPPHAVPAGAAGPVVGGSFRSAARGAATGWAVAYPPGTSAGAALPFLLVLHGRGDESRDVLGSHALGAYLGDAVRRGVPPFANRRRCTTSAPAVTSSPGGSTPRPGSSPSSAPT